MKKISFLFGFLTLIVLLQSCIYQQADKLYPPVVVSTCDTAAVSYDKTIKPMMTTHCNTGSDCHNSASVAAGGGSGFNFETYAEIKNTINNQYGCEWQPRLSGIYDEFRHEISDIL
jgi:hypothetical protein